MTVTDKLNAITEKINIFGGTMVLFNIDAFRFGRLSLQQVRHNELVFRDYNLNSSYYFPFSAFNDTFLESVYISYLAACRENLTESAHKELQEVIKSFYK